MYEPHEKRPEWALTPEEFQTLTCEFCGRPFRRDAAGGVSGGIVILYDDRAPGGKMYFHGYFGRRGCCYERAEAEGLVDAPPPSSENPPSSPRERLREIAEDAEELIEEGVPHGVVARQLREKHGRGDPLVELVIHATRPPPPPPGPPAFYGPVFGYEGEWLTANLYGGIGKGAKFNPVWTMPDVDAYAGWPADAVEDALLHMLRARGAVLDGDNLGAERNLRSAIHLLEWVVDIRRRWESEEFHLEPPEAPPSSPGDPPWEPPPRIHKGALAALDVAAKAAWFGDLETAGRMISSAASLLGPAALEVGGRAADRWGELSSDYDPRGRDREARKLLGRILRRKGIR